MGELHNHGIQNISNLKMFLVFNLTFVGFCKYEQMNLIGNLEVVNL